MASEAPPPYWLLIAVLYSTFPLSDALAMRLYRAALDLHARDQDATRLAGDLASGEVRQLRKTLVLGSLAGPGFEAALDTPRGSGTVRFVVTRRGLEADGAPDEPTGAPN
jgi:hypothetical protein